MDILVHIPMLSISGLLLSEKACWLLIYVLDSVFMGCLYLSDILHILLSFRDEGRKEEKGKTKEEMLFSRSLVQLRPGGSAKPGP